MFLGHIYESFQNSIIKKQFSGENNLLSKRLDAESFCKMPPIVLITLFFSFGRRVATEDLRSDTFYSNTVDMINIPTNDVINVIASSALKSAVECLANTRCNATVVLERNNQLCSLLLFDSNVNVSYTVHSFLPNKTTVWVRQSVMQRNSATAGKQVMTSTLEAVTTTTTSETTSVVITR